MKVSFENARVIIADDHAHLRQIVRASLRAMGIRHVREAEDGGEAFDLFCQSSPDLVLLDLQMAQDGLGCLREIRTSRRSPRPWTPVLMMTAFADKQRVEKMRDLGANAVLVKPLTPALVMTRVAQALSGQLPIGASPRRSPAQPRSAAGDDTFLIDDVA